MACMELTVDGWEIWIMSGKWESWWGEEWEGVRGTIFVSDLTRGALFLYLCMLHGLYGVDSGWVGNLDNVREVGVLVGRRMGRCEGHYFCFRPDERGTISVSVYVAWPVWS